MKLLVRIALLVTAASLLAVLGCSNPPEKERISQGEHAFGQSNGVVEPPQPLPPQKTESVIEQLPYPVTLEERFSYTYGYLLMSTVMKDVQGIEALYFARGALDSGLGGTSLIPSSAMNSILYEYQDKLIQDASRRLEELAAKNLEDAESFLAVNGQREGVFTTDSGLQYEILKEGEGSKPLATDTVRVNYRLTYLDGREGDASVRGIPSPLHLGSMIAGFREGLMLMNKGSEFRFFVHPNLGYGEVGSSRIEPNTLLIFDVELVDIVEQ